MRSSVLLLVLALAACDPQVCTRNSDCAAHLICGDENTCVVPPDMTVLPDGGDHDGGFSDGGSADFSAATDLGEKEDLADSDAARD